MIESICPNCGNKKVFDDEKLGKKYKCPNCSNAVSIEKIDITSSIEKEIILDVKEVKMNRFERIITNMNFLQILVGGFMTLSILWLIMAVAVFYPFFPDIGKGGKHETFFNIVSAAWFIGGFCYMIYIKYIKKF